MLIIAKIFLTAFVVVMLTFVNEYWSPRWAGVLSGFPTGSAITLYFFALEHGLTFAGSSAVYNIAGLVAMQMCIFCFYWIGYHSNRYKLLFSIIGGIIGYLVAITILRQFSFGLRSGIILALISFALFRFIFRSIKEVPSNNKSNIGIVAFRASIAALLVLLVTQAGSIFGHEWAGLFSAFPVTLFPFLIIIHHSYGEENSNVIIKHVPDGLCGLLIYSIVISLAYPKYNLYTGIAFAFSGALAYLILYHITIESWRKHKSNISNY